MGRRSAAVVFLVGLAFAILAPLAAGYIDPTTFKAPKFDSTASLTGGGSSVLLTGPVGCTAKEKADGVQVRMSVAIAQRSAKASGEAI